MKANVRKWVGLLCAVILYYVVHEGAHLVFALLYGVFERVRFTGFGMQIVTQGREQFTDLQFGLFNLSGAVSSLLCAYLLVLAAKAICRSSSLPLKAIAYYCTIALLLTDPIYLSVLCGFFGGGDMNGIVALGIEEWQARLAFGAVGLVNLGLLIQYIYPLYKRSFQSSIQGQSPEK